MDCRGAHVRAGACGHRPHARQTRYWFARHCPTKGRQAHDAAARHSCAAGADGRLTELEMLLASVARDGVVVAPTGDWGYLNMTRNWICHMKRRDAGPVPLLRLGR